jgi:uncharacterized membrane protein YgaE (UPF0421/DUF939 family)
MKKIMFVSSDTIKHCRKAVRLAVKIAIGSSAAIAVAELLRLDYASAAGGIALLTVMGTKWETFRLSLLRILTFVFTVGVMWVTMSLFHNEVIAYGVFVFFLVLLCKLVGWTSTISVNAVIATHFMAMQDFTLSNLWNEFLLVLIGVVIAIAVNQFTGHRTTRKELQRHMKETEQELEMLLGGMAAYLSGQEMHVNVWERAAEMEHKLESYIVEAAEFKENILQEHAEAEYYILYFEMRLKQCIVLHDLHQEMRRMRKLPKQTQHVAEYILYIADYVSDHGVPTKQANRLEKLFDEIRTEPLPETYDEFENYAILYHILLGLEDFLQHKMKFAEQVSEQQRAVSCDTILEQ